MQATADFNFTASFTANSMVNSMANIMAAIIAVFTALPGDRAVVVEATSR